MKCNLSATSFPFLCIAWQIKGQQRAYGWRGDAPCLSPGASCLQSPGGPGK